MSSLARGSMGLALLVVCAGSASADDEHFRVPAEQVVAKVRTIALAPVSARNANGCTAEFAARVEGGIRDRLTAAGVAVVPSSAYAEIWQSLSETLGGTHDPATGQPLEAAYASAQEHTLRELARLHGADAVLEWGLVDGPIPFEQESGFWTSNGDWLAAEQKLLLEGQPFKLPLRVISANGVRAWFHLMDDSAVGVFGTNGVADWTEFRIDSRIEERAAERILALERADAVIALVDPLVEAYAPAPEKKRKKRR